jgi:addiction module RelE/StbE family toxin
MIELVWSGRFTKAVKKIIKRQPELINKISLTIEKLEENPFEPSLHTHKLKGDLQGCFACTVEYDIRIVFEIHKFDEKELIEIFLLSIGSHDEVY